LPGSSGGLLAPLSFFLKLFCPGEASSTNKIVNALVGGAAGPERRITIRSSRLVLGRTEALIECRSGMALHPMCHPTLSRAEFLPWPCGPEWLRAMRAPDSLAGHDLLQTTSQLAYNA